MRQRNNIQKINSVAAILSHMQHIFLYIHKKSQPIYSILYITEQHEETGENSKYEETYHCKFTYTGSKLNAIDEETQIKESK
jgi:hypothetical protein